jgi:hypothetical protein
MLSKRWIRAAGLGVCLALSGAAALAADAVVGDWGEAAAGVTIRARAPKKQWQPNEAIEISLDLRNESHRELGVRRLPYCEVEVDGAWYVPRMGQLVAGAFAVRPGIAWDGFTRLRLTPDRYVLKTDAKRSRLGVLDADPKHRVRFTPGIHRIRVRCDVDAQEPVTAPIVIEVTADQVAATP